MKKRIADQAEVSIDFPEKFYMGSFGRHSSYEVSADDEGVHIYLDRKAGEKRRVGFHLHYYLMADLLASIGEAISEVESLDEPHRDSLERAAQGLAQALAPQRGKRGRRAGR